MTTTLTDLAVVGRRVELTYHRDLNDPAQPAHPGVITSVNADKASVWIRLDGKRYNLPARTDYEGLTYLNEVGDVPELPMGPFTPVADDKNGLYEKEGVLFAATGEDGEDWVVVTDDRDKAYAAARAYAKERGMDLDWINAEGLKPSWAVFEWEPEDAEFPWTVRWDAAEGDDKAVRIHYLPA
ncbi:hypothetical protein [Streptomyces sp. NPDC059916]|uniref:hypothetical protein n=1 Tax=Streptomyces sp. NPDC059916 TaxID=3347001 RepID=UPI0036A18230